MTNPSNFEPESAEYYGYEDSLRKIRQVLWFILALLEVLIGFRIFLRLIAANPNAGFANFIYTVSSPFLVPFFGLTNTPAAEGVVLEIPSIIAMIAYAILFWLIDRGVTIFMSRY